MIEALTPQLLMMALLLATALASLLTLVVAAAVLLAYRRRVVRAMATSAARTAPSDRPWPAPANRAASAPVNAADAIAATRRAAGSVVVAGLAFAAVFAVAALLALPTLRSPVRGMLALWVCAWPIVPALLITMPASRAVRFFWVAAPLLMWAAVSGLDVGAAWLAPAHFGATGMEYLHRFTPPQVLAVWLLINAPPTLMWWLFSNRRLRAVGPLVLGFATAAAGGCIALWLGLLGTRGGLAWMDAVFEATGWYFWTVVGVLLLALLLVSVAIGWVFMHAARQAYRGKRANDRSLQLDALWLLFAVWYAMLLVLAAVPWLLTAPAAFAAYRLTLRAMQQRAQAAARDGAATAPCLVFLRVFSLGRRSDRLFDRLTRYWRHIGSVDLICGPDLAHSTVAPHQLMDFLAGRLASHFVTDPVTLARRLAERDLAPDRDGRYRVNAVYCHADTWTQVLPALVGGRAVVLMDLRSLSPSHQGCVQELHHLVAAVPLRRCVLVVDGSTDRAFLRDTLASAWQAMPDDSPNRRVRPEDVDFQPLAADESSMRALLGRLCAATASH